VPPDGYAWWYVDAIADDGRHGLTVILFVGSVFSPWYAAARRSGPADPLDHVAVNAILYAPGRNSWSMTERTRRDCERGANHIAIGTSAMRWLSDRLVIDIDERTVPIPRRLRGRVTVHPATLFGDVHMLCPNGAHRWRPVAPRARVEVDFRDPAICWKGSAYVDMNAGDAPLERDIRFWNWSRAARFDRTTIHYDLDLRRPGARSLALDYFDDGAVRPAPAPALRPLPQGLWRVRRAMRSESDDLSPVTLEDTPFYTRTRARLRLDGQDVTAIGESVDLDRFASAWVRRLLPFRMLRRAAS
jgi:carotenoid 1,2-hydratase